MAAVVIVGGGPNGLMLGCELALAGVRPVLLERLAHRSGPTRANGLIGRVVDLFDQRGLLQRAVPTMTRPVPSPMFLFGGFILDVRSLPDNPLLALPVAQPRLEELLESRAGELGVDVRRGCCVTDLRQDDEGVDLKVTGPNGTQRLRADWVVGCDGAASTVRKQAGFGFPDLGDTDVVSRGADVVLPDSVGGLATKPTGRGEGVVVPLEGGLQVPGLGYLPFGFTRTSRGVFGVTSLAPGVHTVNTSEWGRESLDPDRPVSIAEIRESVGRVLGADLPMTGPATPGEHRLYRISGNSRQADTYRRGRVLLAGDAAHVHSPIGGPGLNLGLQDSVNLGWKLASVVLDRAPDYLLDTYDAERHPVARHVLRQTQAQMALMAPGPEVTSLREVFAELVQDPGGLGKLAALVAGSDVNYDLGCDHPAAGRWVPDLPLKAVNGPHAYAERTRVAELMRAGRPVLLDLTSSGHLVQAAAQWKDRVDLIRAELLDPATRSQPNAYLIRPDGYAAWASPESADGLTEALAYWFGDPD